MCRDEEKIFNNGISGNVIGIQCMCSICKEYGFDDLPKSHWAYETIMQLSDENVIDGFDNNTFEPEEKVTREQFIKLLVCSNS